MKRLSIIILLFSIQIVANNLSATTEDDAIYTSWLSDIFDAPAAGASGSATIRGLNGVDDVAGVFLDMDDNGVIDGFRLDALQQGSLLGSQSHTFSVVNANGTRFISFPLVQSNNFSPGPSDLLPNLPDTALPMVPITDDDRFELTLADGTPILAFNLDLDGLDGADSEFVINLGLVGAWFDPSTPEQGYLIDFLIDQQFIFIAWFTYTPSGDLIWFTARGNFQGNRAELNVIQSNNGLFNQPTTIVQNIVGTLIIEFTDCLNGTIEFNLPDFGANDIVPITRIAGDQICQPIVDGTLILP